jgi:hypothetical protein
MGIQREAERNQGQDDADMKMKLEYEDHIAAK